MIGDQLNLRSQQPQQLPFSLLKLCFFLEGKGKGRSPRLLSIGTLSSTLEFCISPLPFLLLLVFLLLPDCEDAHRADGDIRGVLAALPRILPRPLLHPHPGPDGGHPGIQSYLMDHRMDEKYDLERSTSTPY